MVSDSGTNYLVPNLGFMMIALVSLAVPVLAFLVVIWLVVRAGKTSLSTGYGSAEARLTELARLQQQGLITQAEYDERRAAILESI